MVAAVTNPLSSPILNRLLKMASIPSLPPVIWGRHLRIILSTVNFHRCRQKKLRKRETEMVKRSLSGSTTSKANWAKKNSAKSLVHSVGSSTQRMRLNSLRNIWTELHWLRFFNMGLPTSRNNRMSEKIRPSRKRIIQRIEERKRLPVVERRHGTKGLAKTHYLSLIWTSSRQVSKISLFMNQSIEWKRPKRRMHTKNIFSSWPGRQHNIWKLRRVQESWNSSTRSLASHHKTGS